MKALFILTSMAGIVLVFVSIIGQMVEAQKVLNDWSRSANLVRVCPGGTKIYEWHGQLYAHPSQRVAATLKEVC